MKINYEITDAFDNRYESNFEKFRNRKHKSSYGSEEDVSRARRTSRKNKREEKAFCGADMSEYV